MLRRTTLPFVLVVIAALALTPIVLAGGWAVITLDQLPAQVIAGQPLTIGFMVRQHGHTPWVNDNVSVSAKQTRVRVVLRLAPRDERRERGNAAQAYILPRGARCSGVSSSNLYPPQQPMPALNVLPASAAGHSSASAVPPISLPAAIGLIGLVVSVGAGLIWLRTRTRPALAVTVSVAVISLAAVALTAGQASASIAQPINSGAQSAALSPAELGKELFVAKGCIVCHQHDALYDVKNQIGFSYDGAPNLTDIKIDPDYLHRWLKDPAAIKPDTFMPTLGLNDREIDALVAFLTKSQ